MSSPALYLLVHANLQQFVHGGARLAPLMPIYALIGWAMGDYESMRLFLTSASSEEMSEAVMFLLVMGFVMGGAVQLAVNACSRGRVVTGVGMSRIKRRESEAWYWAQKADGHELAIREVTTGRCTPNAETRWAIHDLIVELGRAEGSGGSDLMDRKVMKLLGIQTQDLKPTQRVDDAKRLLEMRYLGRPSMYEWDVKTEPSGSGFMALIVVRPPARSSEVEPSPWQRCVIAEGPSEALAVTIAAITRETWTYTT